MHNLDPRKQTILRAVIVEYVHGAEPVGSELLASKYQFGVRSATVRNELAEMADLGYLEQPHTSAGRIPSDKGYRYYVDHLVLRREPKKETQEQVKQAATEGEMLQTMLRDTTKLLSRFTQLLSAATTISNPKVTVKHAVISALGPDRALLVMVFSNGHIENRLIECPHGLTLDDLGQANDILMHSLVGQSVQTIRSLRLDKRAGTVPVEKLLESTVLVIRAIARELTKGILITEGEEYMFAQPEFKKDAGSLHAFIHALEQQDQIHQALSVSPGSTQTISIGKENQASTMQQLTLVKQTFFVGSDEAGTLALIGPTRMNYDNSIPLLDFTAKAISETLTRLLT